MKGSVTVAPHMQVRHHSRFTDTKACCHRSGASSFHVVSRIVKQTFRSSENCDATPKTRTGGYPC